MMDLIFPSQPFLMTRIFALTVMSESYIPGEQGHQRCCIVAAAGGTEATLWSVGGFLVSRN